MSSAVNSAVAVAKLLGCDGFTEHLANKIDQFARRQMTGRQQRSHDRTEAAMAKLCRSLSEGDRRVIGKFITLHKSMAFTTGLRIGLTASATQTPRNWEQEPWFPSSNGSHSNHRCEVEIEMADGEWLLLKEFDHVKDAKILAHNEAKARQQKTRVRKPGGSVIQRYREDGDRIGGD